MLFREDNVARADADAIRKGVGFYRWTHDIVEITGKDALEVLQKIYISNISKVAVGRSKYTASLDENGEIIDDVIVMHMADGLYWVSDLYGPRLLPWIEKHKGTADIQTKIITYDWDMYAIQGPDSINAMNAMLDKPIDELKRFGICERKIGDIPVYIHRSGFTGENGYEIGYSGAMSWTMPWLAGLYALCCQVKPEITPDEFRQTVRETAQVKSFGKLVDPVAIIRQLQGEEN